MKRLAAMQDCPLLSVRGLDADGDRFIEVSAGHHDEGIAAAEFEDHFLDSLRRARADFYTRAFAAGQSSRGDAGIVQDAVHLVGADQQSLKRALGKAGLQQNFFNFQRALRNVGRVFQKAHVAGHQSRRDEAEHLPERDNSTA